VLVRDIADVKRLRDATMLLTLGCIELVHALLADDLVDAMTVFTFPVVLGGGTLRAPWTHMSALLAIVLGKRAQRGTRHVITARWGRARPAAHRAP
jgi:hypothetical protein